MGVLEDATRPIPWTYKYGNRLLSKRWDTASMTQTMGLPLPKLLAGGNSSHRGRQGGLPVGAGTHGRWTQALRRPPHGPAGLKNGENTTPPVHTWVDTDSCCPLEGKGRQMWTDGDGGGGSQRWDGWTDRLACVTLVHEPDSENERFR